MLVEIDREELNRLLEIEDKYSHGIVDISIELVINKLKKENELLRKEVIEARTLCQSYYNDLQKYKSNRGAGRKVKYNNSNEMKELRNAGYTLKQIADKFGCSIGTVHNLIK